MSRAEGHEGICSRYIIYLYKMCLLSSWSISKNLKFELYLICMHWAESQHKYSYSEPAHSGCAHPVGLTDWEGKHIKLAFMNGDKGRKENKNENQKQIRREEQRPEIEKLLVSKTWRSWILPGCIEHEHASWDAWTASSLQICAPHRNMLYSALWCPDCDVGPNINGF